MSVDDMCKKYETWWMWDVFFETHCNYNGRLIESRMWFIEWRHIQ